MEMHVGFKVSEGEGRREKGGLGEEAVYPCPPAPAPSSPLQSWLPPAHFTR